MTTIAQPTRPKTAGGPRTRGSVRARAGVDDREAQYDLLTAALLGVAIGVGTTLLLRRGPSGERPLSPVMRGAARAGKVAATAGRKGARWARKHGEQLWEKVPYDHMEHQIRDYASRAREAIEEAVDSELKDLRKTIRRQRRRLGV